MSRVEQQKLKIKTESGFIAALDQSGGSTPKALGLYGVKPDAWTNEEGMYKVVHDMRTRIITSPGFNGKRLIGAILFENTMDREINGKPTADYLWEDRNVVPFLKIDKGMEDEKDGAQVMKAMPALDALLKKAVAKHIFGTKMRSVVAQANAVGVAAVVKQQFEVGKQIIAAGLMPIIEPEVDIKCPQKTEAEKLLKAAILDELNKLGADQMVMLKLTLPEQDNFYSDLIKHPKVLKVVALSGGYSQEESNARLSRNNGMVASFSRALAEGLFFQQSDTEFNATLDATIEGIYQASKT